MALRIAQLDPFALAGGGVVAGATEITLKSFTAIDGVTPLTMADFGTIGYGTLEPGNGNLEEQISFTGIVQNSNGTATLTGVSSVLFLNPYTESSGLNKTHAGSTTFVISNTAGFYNQFAIKQNNETITGQWTFENTPITPPAISFASTTVAGIVQEATPAQTLSKTAVGDTGAQLFSNPANAASTLLSDYVVDTGIANAYVIAPSPAITAYTVGQIFTFKATISNTTSSTLAVNGLAAKSIKNVDESSLTANAIVAGQIVMVEYDGTNFQLISRKFPQTATFVASVVYTNGVATRNLSTASGNQVIAHGLGVIPQKVRIHSAFSNDIGVLSFSDGTYENSVYARVSYLFSGATNATVIATDTVSIVILYDTGDPAGNRSQTGTVTVDATNITIAWVKAGSGANVAVPFTWEVEGYTTGSLTT